MTEPLEQALTDLGGHLHYPPTPDLSQPVREAIERGDLPRRTTFLEKLRRRRLQIALAAVVITGAAIGLTPAARSAVASWFHIPGVEIGSPGPLPGPLGKNLTLGERVSLHAAEDGVSFRVLLPAAPGLGPPDEVYVANQPQGGRVSLLYRARSGFPRASTTGAGLLITEFKGTTDPFLVKRIAVRGGRFVFLTIGSHNALWIEGPPHVMYYLDSSGVAITDSIRLAGNTLLWEAGDVTLRLEGKIDEQRAVAIAESMAPVRG